jgi:hypothetical protein
MATFEELLAQPDPIPKPLMGPPKPTARRKTLAELETEGTDQLSQEAMQKSNRDERRTGPSRTSPGRRARPPLASPTWPCLFQRSS